MVVCHGTDTCKTQCESLNVVLESRKLNWIVPVQFLNHSDVIVSFD